MEDNVTEEQPNLGSYCLQYSYIIKSTAEHQQTKVEQNNGSLENS